jgi:hypothetical protein
MNPYGANPAKSFFQLDRSTVTERKIQPLAILVTFPDVAFADDYRRRRVWRVGVG